jgi:3'(2'), 5'-bisphosphate nucleotidase
LLEIRRDLDRGRPAAEVRRDGDLKSHEFIASFLRTLRPGDALLSEEGLDDPRRLSAERVWIIDPLDGTNEFGEHGRDDWAVHVALVQEGRLAAGAVALPELGRTFSTHSVRMVHPPTRRLRVAVSRSRPPREAQVLVDRLDAELCAMGTAGAKAMAVVSGAVDAYVHSGGQYEWDSAAPVAVATAAGLHASRLDGSELEYNKPSPWLPDLLICREELRAPILAALA